MVSCVKVEGLPMAAKEKLAYIEAGLEDQTPQICICSSGLA